MPTLTTTRMRSEVRDEWVALLESGQFEQTTDQLRDEDGFCCLGVLCLLASRKTNSRIPVSSWENESLPPERVLTWAGFDVAARRAQWVEEMNDPNITLAGDLYTEADYDVQDDMEFYFGTPEGDLAELNDGNSVHNIKQHTFKQIAKIIRKRF